MKLPPKIPPLPGAGEKKAAPPVKPALEAVAVVAASGKYEAKPASATDTWTAPEKPDAVLSRGGNAASKAADAQGKSTQTVLDENRAAALRGAAEQQAKDDREKAEAAARADAERAAAARADADRAADAAELARFSDLLRLSYATQQTARGAYQASLKVVQDFSQVAAALWDAEGFEKAVADKNAKAQEQKKAEENRKAIVERLTALNDGRYEDRRLQKVWSEQVIPSADYLDLGTYADPDILQAWKEWRADHKAWKKPAPAGPRTDRSAARGPDAFAQAAAEMRAPPKNDTAALALLALAAKLLFF